MDQITLWGETHQILKEKISPTLLKIWFTKVQVVKISKTKFGEVRVVLAFPNKFLTEQIKKRVGGVLISAFEKVLGEKVDLEFTFNDKAEQTFEVGEREFQSSNFSVDGKGELGENYTFENFVVGDSNKLASSAAKAVCTKPGTLYNPLFIYGGTGLGKTHLLKACAAELSQNFPNLKIAYKTTEAFTNEFVDSLAAGNIKLFREKYRHLDVLLIDDIQFLSGKPGTQDGFFHTFNELYSAHHQIILTSDRHPSEIGRLEERLVSRFLGGLTADIAPCELELKMAILSKKAANLSLNLDGEVVEFLAEIVENPREIEGAVAAVSQSLKLGGSKDLAAVKTLFDKKHSHLKLAPKQLISAVAKFYGVKSADLTGKARKKELVRARQMAMFLLRSALGLSYDFIGQLLGGKDHSTIIYGVRAVKKEVERVGGPRNDLAEIRRVLSL